MSNIWDRLYEAKLELPKEPLYVQLAQHAIDAIQEDEFGEFLPLPYGSKWIRHDIIRTEKGCFIKIMI